MSNMNFNKTIKDLKKRNDKLQEQYRLRDIRCVHLEKENEELKKQVEEVELIVGLRQKRNLIRKFDKEYDQEDKKNNPNRDYAGVMPDAEEVYKRYYNMKNQQKEFIKYLEDEINKISKEIKHYDIWHEVGDINFLILKKQIYKKILSKYKEIIGDVE